jgi:hypothetical protein
MYDLPRDLNESSLNRGTRRRGFFPACRKFAAEGLDQSFTSVNFDMVIHFKPIKMRFSIREPPDIGQINRRSAA